MFEPKTTIVRSTAFMATMGFCEVVSTLKFSSKIAFVIGRQKIRSYFLTSNPTTLGGYGKSTCFI